MLQGLDAIHIISHGAAGQIQLGSTTLANDSLNDYAGQLSEWGSALADSGDILIYGCDLAADVQGKALVDAISAATGADVAASTDQTGNTQHGGDWDLEYRPGAIETAAFAMTGTEAWSGVLALVNVTTFNDLADGGDTSSIANLIATPGTDGISLREAIIASNNDSGVADTIALSAGTYTLAIAGTGEDAAATGDLDILDPLTITGVGADQTIIDGAGLDRVFQVIAGSAFNVTMSDLKIQNGFVDNQGAGLYIGNLPAAPVVTLSNVWFSGNHTTGTADYGGAIFNRGDLTIEDSLIEGNSAEFGGGVMNFTDGILNISNTTISGNSATAGDGGGLYNLDVATLVNVTVADNSASNGGGGMYNKDAAGATTTINNTLVADNTASSNADLDGAFVSSGDNLIETVGSATGLQGSDITGSDPALGALEDNGGPTQTHALLAGSLAINMGSAAGAPVADQRGVARSDSLPDIGAFEVPNQAAFTSLLFTTSDDVTGSGVPGLDSWGASALLEIGDPGLSFGPGTTSGSIATLVDLGPMGLAADSIDAIHYVGTNISVGGANAVALQPGDLLLSVNVNGVTLTSTNSIVVDEKDVFVFSPDIFGDYSQGVFTLLLDGTAMSGKVGSISLVEERTLIGDAIVEAGDFLFSDEGASSNQILHFSPTDVGLGTTAGSETVLIDGDDIDVDESIVGIELIETATTIGSVSLEAGQILLTLLADDIALGNVPTLDTKSQDVVVLDVTATGSGTSAATATMLLDGDNINLEQPEETIAGVSLIPTPLDTDGDGLWDIEEDADLDLDRLPSTNPDPDTDGDTTPNYLDADDDGDGTPTSAENADPNADGDPRDAIDTDRDGQADYLDLPTDASDGTVTDEQKISATVGGLTSPLDPDDRFGKAISGIGDLDGDGINDIVVGAMFDDDGGTDRGAVYILFLNADGTVKSEQKISAVTGGLTGTIDDGDSFGQSVAGIGDVDGDGVIDLVVSAERDDDGGADRGAVHILFMNPDGTVKAEQKISSTSGGLTATLLDDSDFFGAAVTGLGDLDGDGINDIAVGAPRGDDGGLDRGEVHILFLNANGTVKAEQTISSTIGGLTAMINDDDRVGSAVSGIGDLDGDGLFDIAVGAQLDDDGGADRGAVHILFLNADGTVKDEQKISAVEGVLTAALNDGDRFGVAVAGIGDVDADGIGDIAVGASFDDDGGADRGAAYILFLNSDGTVKGEQKISSVAGDLTGPLADGDLFASGLAGLGDLDGDGAIDIVVGASKDDDGAADSGAVYVLNLTPTGAANNAPVLAAIGNQSVDELATLSFTSSATDSDLPGDSLTYTLDAGSIALGMSIHPTTGAFSWTPTEAQGGLTPSVTVTVTDDGTGTLVDSEVITITVNEVNVSPVLAAIGNQSVDELATLSFTASATDSDDPADTLTYSLDAPAVALGMSIHPTTGAFSWTPTEAQGGLTPSVTITVTDDGTGNLVDSEVITITVNEVNTAPVLAAIGNQSVDELATLSFTASATDSDLPGDSLTYSLDAPAVALGMSIHPTTGAFSWTPTEAQGGLTPSVTITVTDDGTGNLVDSEVITITVNEVNSAPVLAAIGNQSVDELSTLSFTASATDSDDPADNLSYSLDAPSIALGMSIHPTTGAFSWTPTEAQGGLTPSVTITVTDDGTGSLVDSEVITITVNEVNNAPVLGGIGNQSIDELATLSFTASATDSDDPADNLSYSLDAPAVALGMSIHPTTGAFSWTPTEAQGGLTPSVTVTVTDDGTGTLVDSEVITITVNEVNNAPVLGGIGNQSIDELATLSFTASATDSDDPADNLSYSLDAPSIALGMSIHPTTGAFSWTPTEAQGGLTPSVTITVTDDGTGNLVDSEVITITVNEVNSAPVLAAIGNQSVDELSTLSFTASATDSDDPADNLSYSLDAPSIALGMSIHPTTGAFSWTPTEAQGGLTPSVTITVTDDGTGKLVDSEVITITVNEVNVSPVLAAIGNQSVDELATLSFTASATDSDLPGDSLTYTLDAGSIALGMSIHPTTGAFSWTPTEAQGGLTPSVTVTVTDDGTGTLVDSEVITITVNEVNNAPVLGGIGNQSIDELATLSFTASATDSDLPGDSLTYTLDAGSIALGMSIHPTTGAFSWTPTEAQGGLTPSVTITVTDDGTGKLVDSEVITITVNEVNVSPVLAAIGNQSVDELATLSFTASATDSDLPGDSLTYTLDAGSIALGMSIHPTTGAFSWTPTEAQGGLTPSVTVTVTDDGTGTLVDSEVITITVNEVNSAPVLAAIGNQSVDELATLSFTASATDSDLPGDSLTYSLDAPAVALGMSIHPTTGAFSWTPTEAQGGLTPSVTITVTDDGTGNLVDSEVITITVNEVNSAPVLAAIGNQSVDELSTLSFTASATDSDDPADNLSYSLDAPSIALGMSIHPTTGAFSWTPTEAQGGLTPSVTVTVTDDGTGTLVDSEVITITVNEVNVSPVLAAIGNQSVDELATLSFTASATDSDDPADTLTYSLDAPAVALGMSIHPTTGAFSWTPTEAQGGLTPSVTITVTDDGTGNLVDSEVITITVNEVNTAPVLAAIGNQSVDELATLSFTASATDSDLPGDSLTYSLDAPAVALGMSIHPTTGAFSWTPTEAQGGLTPSVTITVTDDGTGNLVDSEVITITVNEVNSAPVLAAIGNQSVDELSTLSFTASATDSDDPADNLSYSLDAPSIALGMSIHPTTGAFSWTPTEAQGGLTPSVTVTVTDDGTGTLVDSEVITITVNEVNVSPVLAAIGNQSVDELATLSFTASATDSDDPADTLTYSLDAPAVALGMSIHPTTGAFSWTPTEAQGGLTPSVTVTVTDDGTGNLVDSEVIAITVNEVNVAPIATNLNSTSLYGEGTASVGITDIVVSDGDTAEVIAATLTLANTATGSLSATDGATYTAGTGVWTITDTVANVNTALANLVFSPTPNNDLDTTISINIDDADEDSSGALAGIVTLDVTPQNDEQVLAINTGLTVNEGSTGTIIDNTLLDTTDADHSSAQVIYTLTTVPSNGSLKFGGSTLTLSDTFTQDDVDNSRITYDHDGSETTSDSFNFSVDDGVGAASTGTFTITVTPQNDEQMVVVNTGATVVDGSTGTMVTALMLDTTDADNTATQVIYTLTTAPGNGTLKLNDTVLNLSDTFTQDDIDTGKVTYDHDGSVSTSDSFDFSVDDGVGTAITGTFSITIAAQNDEQIIAVNAGATVVEGSTGSIIDNTLLDTFDLDNSAVQLVYTVTAVPGNGTLNLSGTVLNLSDTFTQDDIDNSRITYDHDGSETTSDSFNFSVDDGAGSASTGIFSLAITAQNDAPIQVSSIPDQTAIEDNTFSFQIANGTFQDNDAGDSLTYSVSFSSGAPLPDWLHFDAGTRTFSGIPSDADAGTINIRVTASDSSDSGVTDDFNIEVIAVNDAPIFGNHSIILDSGATVTLTAAMLPVSDIDNADKDLILTVSGVSGGQFELISETGTTINSFNYSQVISGSVVFIDDGDNIPPVYSVAVSDGEFSIGPIAANVSFSAAPPIAAANELPLDQTPAEPVVPTEAPMLEPLSLSADFLDAIQFSADKIPDVIKEEVGVEEKKVSESTGETVVHESNTVHHRELISADIAEPIGVTAAVNSLQGILAGLLAQHATIQQLLTAPFELDRLDAEIRLVLLSDSFRNSLDRMSDGINDATFIKHVAIGSSVVVTSGLSVGYVAWLVRGGVLLGTALSSLPAWQFIDPLPILSGSDDSNDPDERGNNNDSLEEIINDQTERTVATQTATPDDEVFPQTRWRDGSAQ